MRSIDLLINQSRRATGNTEFSSNAGIQDEEFIQYLNDAQDRLQSLFVQLNADLFQDERLIAAVAGQEAYDIPDDAYLGHNRIDMIEYAANGLESEYSHLKQGRMQERFSGVSSTPAFYFRRSGQFLVQPQPDEGGIFRVTYTKKLPRLDIRRGTIASVTLTSNTISSLTLDTALQIDETELEEENYITVINKYGAVQMRRIPVSDVDSGSGIVTLDAGFTFESGETITVGDFVTRGRESTTHSQLPDMVERYLIEYMNIKILNRDSSDDVASQSPILQSIEKEITDTFSEVDADPDYITILDDQFLLPGDDFHV